MSEDSLIAECPDVAAGKDTSRLVLTNLELYSMPLIRYDAGDLVTLQGGAPCPCGRPSRRIAKVQGRSVDCIKLPGGETLLPYDITRTIELVEGIGRYRVVQRRLEEFEVHYEGAESDEAARRGNICEAMTEALGYPAKIDVFRSDNIDPPAGRKFRVIESQVE
jgi:phenylacetate-CoA ligase